MVSPLFAPLPLPNGHTLPNRIAKAAMEENLADAGQLPGPALWRLYAAWGAGGAGLLITGNVMIDRRALTGPGGVVLERGTPLEPFRRWAEAARRHGARTWMQINHPGRQVIAALGHDAWAPSAIALDLGRHSKLFARPRAMTAGEIHEVVERFADTAAAAQAAGFDGVEIHAAHGYLISQFLSPLTNRRDDAWGGSLENRARLLLSVVRAVREHVGTAFGVAVKLNSADFQRGGFSEDDARQIVLWLNNEAVDLVELSGGSYESPAMQGRTADGRTLAREAYFLRFAREIAAVARMPVMTTGGIRRQAIAESVLDAGVAVVGMATALASVPDLPQRWHDGQPVDAPLVAVRWQDKAAAGLATMALVKRRLYAIAAGRRPRRSYSAVYSLVIDRIRTRKLAARYREWRNANR
ncbi:NADH:flavin oxidoreductase/NADH oxidase family protein [Paraburkholderia sp. Ac-20336]|uniref:NADH:flavin oxidoreductase/NADH oxidase family protein n=1 Tax=Paraburkholderia sp. Ac-20336 TaxID=2703886 RepID=UPI0019820E3A|nr:NADH:flavin oxidoreductase/NADH oxidase family protein [Paraburkholderia sp. Ac-20336]MBN3802373.1 NADH:flavin oxidoreductase/NADH oxidase family protein [Paraburkholderia sp. Ac-20336]